MGASVIISLKIMPDSPEANLDAIAEEAVKRISEFGGNVGKKEVQPVAFGLKAVMLMFAMPEEKGSTEELEKQLAEIEHVSSAQVEDVRRAVG